jgi:4-hydroxy-tetrahydrodipicolinate reductase
MTSDTNMKAEPPISLAISGATGRMGRAVARLCLEVGGFKIVGASAGPNDPALGQDLGLLAGLPNLGVAISDDIDSALLGADVVIDFSLPPALQKLARLAPRRGVALVSGTTGMDDLTLLDEAAKHIPVLHARNMSVGIQVLSELVSEAVKKLGPEFDVEITEIHHRHKKDAPSGTAKHLADAVREVRHVVPVHGRNGDGRPRATDDIGIFGLRGGDVIGDHTVHLLGPGERIELTHRATNRELFASGAIRAARWIAGKPPGRYTLADVLRGS